MSAVPLRIYGRRPLTRLEAGLYAVIVGVLIAVLMERLLDQMALAERSTVETTLNNLMSAVNTRLAYERMRGQAPNLEAWVRGNPFELAGASPGNFAGEIDAVQAADLARGSWAFDRDRGELVYLPRLPIGLITEGALRFRADLGNGGVYRIVAVEPHQ